MPGMVGVVGLGLMGIHIARRLLARGYSVTGFDIDPDRIAELQSAGGTAAPDIATVARSATIVLLSLPNGAVSQEVCLGPEGIAAGFEGRQCLVMDTTTARPEEAVELSRALAAFGISFLDVGLSGSGPMITEGKGLCVAGGPDDAWAAGRELLQDLCEEALHIGGHGAGMTAKLVINLVLYINRIALAEGLLLAEHSGIGSAPMLGALRKSAARSTAMDLWGDRMVDRHYSAPTSRIRQHVKDVHQIVELADRAGLRLLALPQVALIAETAIQQGLHESDNSVVIEVIRDLSGARSAGHPN